MPQRPTELDGIPERVKEGLDKREINQSELARRIKARPGTISTMMSGKTAPDVDTLAAIAKELRMYPSYLMLGIGPKFFEDSTQGLAPVDIEPASIAQPPHGVDQWLLEHPEVDEDDRAWLRAVPWPMAHLKQPDLVYFTALTLYHQAQQAVAPRTTPVPDGQRSRP